MVSIRQNAYPDVLPDFRNLAVIARILIAVNAAVFAATLLAVSTLAQALERFVQSAAFFEPLLLLIVTVLFALSGALRRLPYWPACGIVLAVVCVLVALYAALVAEMSDQPLLSALPRLLLFCVLVAAGLLIYFRLRAKAHSPALAEARLQALQARIRPHFLFNSLNAVLALIRFAR
jgi:two-component system, LytTR family, sensor histidine kinase AlgZ